MIKRLPNWVLTQKNPAFYDTESKTAVEQTAKLYGKMQELIDSVNLFVDQVNDEMDSFTSTTEKDITCFKDNITKIMNNYISSIDTKILTDLTKFINQAIDEGKIVITTSYDETNENLEIVGGA